MRQLRHVTRMAYGSALAAEVRVEGPVPVMSSGGATGHHNVANTLSPVIVIGRKGSQGSVHWSDDPAFVIDTAYFIDRRLTTADLRWLYYALLSVDLKGVSQDVGVPGLSREAAYGLHLTSVPNLTDQRRIADFLDDQVNLLDRAVQNRGAQIDLLAERRSSSLEAIFGGSEDRLLPLRRVVAKWIDYRGATPMKTISGVPLVTAKNIRGGEVTFETSSVTIQVLGVSFVTVGAAGSTLGTCLLRR